MNMADVIVMLSVSMNWILILYDIIPKIKSTTIRMFVTMIFVLAAGLSAITLVHFIHKLQ